MKWRKTLLVSTGILSTSAILAPIAFVTSCSNAPVFIDEDDQENGVSSATYHNMKDQLTSLYRTQLEQQWLPEDEKKEKLDELNKKLETLDSVLEDSKQQTAQAIVNGEPEQTQNAINYTALTSSLNQFALEDYQIQLVRESTMTWEDLRFAYDGFRDSNEIYMHNLKLPEAEIQRELRNADNQFDAIMDEMQESYRFDPLLGYQVGLPKLLTCFETVNLETAALGAQERLKDFLSKFEFVFNVDGKGNHFDEIKNYLQIGKPLSTNLMNKMFKCTEVATDMPWTYDPDTLLPGYHLDPYLATITEDPFANHYRIGIDWAIVDAHYLNTPDREAATAYLFKSCSWNPEEEPDLSVPEIFAKCEHAITEYELYPSESYEQQQIENAYFNHDMSKAPEGYVHLKWNDNPKSPDNKYEQFFTGIKEGEKTGNLSVDCLGRSGLLISSNDTYFEKVTDVLAKVELDRNIDDSLLPLTERFLKNCDVRSKVTIVNGDNHTVTNKLIITYKNSTNPNAQYTGLPIFNNNGYLVSPEFFETANVAYNKAYRWVHIYQDNNYATAREQAIKLRMTTYTDLAVAAAMTAYYIVKIIFPPYSDTGSYALALAFGISTIAIWTAYVICVEKHMIGPYNKLYNSCKKLANSPEYKTMTEKIASDNKYFCLSNDDGTYDKRKYNKAYETFGGANFETTTRPLYQFYSNFDKQTLTKDFAAKVEELGIDGKTTYNILNPWITLWGYWNIFAAGKLALSTAVSVAFGPVLINPAKKWWVKAGITLIQAAFNFAIGIAAEYLIYTFRYFVTGEAIF